MVFGVFSSNWEADDLPTNLFWLSSSLRLWPQEHKLTKPSLAHQPHLPEFRGRSFQCHRLPYLGRASVRSPLKALGKANGMAMAS